MKIAPPTIKPRMPAKDFDSSDYLQPPESPFNFTARSTVPMPDTIPRPNAQRIGSFTFHHEFLHNFPSGSNWARERASSPRAPEYHVHSPPMERIHLKQERIKLAEEGMIRFEEEKIRLQEEKIRLQEHKTRLQMLRVRFPNPLYDRVAEDQNLR